YFQVINQEQDLTLYAHSMSKRGTMLGTEYRLTPNLKSKGLFHLDWLHDRKKEDSFDNFENYERPSDQRYWLRGKYNGFLLTPDWRAKLDLDLVSDKYYLREFDYGMQGFEQTRGTFMEEFGRDTADKDDPIRENVFSLSRNWADTSLRTRLEYNQNLNYFRDDPGEDPTLQRLPQIDLDLHRRSLLDSPLEWEAKNQATHFWRRKEDKFKGTRLDMNPRIRLPLQSAYGTVTPSLGWRETLYHTQETEENGSQPEEFETRGIWDFSSTASTELFRIFRLNPVDDLEADSANRGESQWSMLKHSVRPEATYDYVPEVDQTDLPEYDSLDRIGKQNEITYSLSNLFTLRKDQIVAVSGANGTRYERDKQYRDLLSLKLEQSYDFHESRRSNNLDTNPQRPFSDIRMKAELTPFSWISLTDTTWYSPYVDAVTEHQHRLDLSGGPLSTYFAYDYQREMEQDIHRSGQDKLSIMRVGASLNPGSNWLLGYDTERNLETSKLIERQATLGYQHQCWNLRVIYTERPDETRVSLTVGLVPFGEMEQRMWGQGQGIFTQEEE
ncbi:MAG: LPS-assembly protein LptD, partial [Desulfohalobiaceae bacterium]|nr:LPS-assembly protein LptD [Desulfohalobiaceae bacterium]